MIEALAIIGIFLNVWTTSGLLRTNMQRRYILMNYIVGLILPFAVFIGMMIDSQRADWIKGPFHSQKSESLLGQALNGNPTPTMMLANMIGQQIIMDLELPKEYKGEKLKEIERHHIEEVDGAHRWRSAYELGDLKFTREENAEINRAYDLAKSLRVKKDTNDFESDRQQKAISIIEKGLQSCGTSLKNTIDVSQEKLPPPTQSIYLTGLEEGLKINTGLSPTARHLLEQKVKHRILRQERMSYQMLSKNCGLIQKR